jgi:curli biogenesis system outer membrane secretion channel CsgG
MGETKSSLNQRPEAQACWEKAAELDPNGTVGEVARQRLARMSVAAAVSNQGAMPAGKPSGLKATMTVGDFQVKAANAGQYIGDGLREMFLTALHKSGYFIALERMDIQGVAAEQALSHSPMARKESALPAGQMDVADIAVYGAVTEFEPEAKGFAYPFFFGSLPMTGGQAYRESHMAIDIRVVEVQTGRLLGAQRIPGIAMAMKTDIGAAIPLGGINLPASLSVYKNTPMEEAIRDCIQKATIFAVNNIPEAYFRHR